MDIIEKSRNLFDKEKRISMTNLKEDLKGYERSPRGITKYVSE